MTPNDAASDSPRSRLNEKLKWSVNAKSVVTSHEITVDDRSVVVTKIAANRIVVVKIVAIIVVPLHAVTIAALPTEPPNPRGQPRQPAAKQTQVNEAVVHREAIHAVVISAVATIAVALIREAVVVHREAIRVADNAVVNEVDDAIATTETMGQHPTAHVLLEATFLPLRSPMRWPRATSHCDHSVT